MIRYDDFDILASDSNKLKESLLIKRGWPVLNRTKKSFQLHLFDKVLMFTFYKNYDQC